MSYHISAERGQGFHVVRQAFLQDDQLPLANVLTEKEIEPAFGDEACSFGQGKDAVYTPALTLFGFLAQVMAAGVGRSCNAAGECIRSLCLVLGSPAPPAGFRG